MTPSRRLDSERKKSIVDPSRTIMQQFTQKNTMMSKEKEHLTKI
jgi:hypothetical protein